MIYTLQHYIVDSTLVWVDVGVNVEVCESVGVGTGVNVFSFEDIQPKKIELK